MNITKKIIASLFLILFANACVETVVVGTAATAVMIKREKTFSDTKDDVKISTYLAAKFIKNGLKTPGNSIDITINEGRVLLTGIVRDDKKAKLATELAWKVRGVKEVIDEIKVTEDAITAKDFTKGFRDYVITTQINTKMLFSKKVASVNYKVTTVAKTVYLLGVSKDDAEMRNALSIAAKTSGVRKVVNHLILANDSRRNG